MFGSNQHIVGAELVKGGFKCLYFGESAQAAEEKFNAAVTDPQYLKLWQYAHPPQMRTRFPADEVASIRATLSKSLRTLQPA